MLLRVGLCPCLSCAGEWLCAHSLFSCQVTHMASMSLGISAGSREARYIGFIGLCRDPFESGGRSLSTSTSTQEDNRRVLGFPPGVRAPRPEEESPPPQSGCVGTPCTTSVSRLGPPLQRNVRISLHLI